MLKAYKTFLLSIILLPLQIFSASISGQLDNGFQYVIEEKQNVKEQVAIRLVVKVGSIYEEEEEKGIAHFVEHMLFKGTESFPNFQAIQELASLGAEFGRQVNATTKMDHTEFVIDLPLYQLINSGNTLSHVRIEEGDYKMKGSCLQRGALFLNLNYFD